MTENKNGLVERIIKELNHVLFKPGLTDFDIVPVESNMNKSPVLYVDTSVGLESWCVKHVFMHCYTELLNKYLTNPKRRLSRPSNLNHERLTVLLNTTLLLNPDISTLWNKRREMLDKIFLEWVSELQFSRLVLSRKPKCNDAYAYRKWILSDVFKEDVVHPHQFIDALIEEELNLCNMAADKCPNNYHCWEHRRWLMNITFNIRFDFDYTLLYFNEYKFIQQWSANHVSDYSCFHYRQFILQKLYYTNERWSEFEKMMEVDLRENFLKVIAAHKPNHPTVKPNKTLKKTLNDNELVGLILDHCSGECECEFAYSILTTCRKFELLFYEIVLNDELLKFYKYHETLWYHRRFVVHEILATMYQHLDIERRNGKLERKILQKIDGTSKCQNCIDSNLRLHGKMEKFDASWIYHTTLFKVLIRHEKEIIKNRRRDSDKYADRHEHYLKYVEGLNSYI